MKTVDTAPGGGAAAPVGFPMKSSKCKFILLRGTNLHGVWGFFPCRFSSFSSRVSCNSINKIIHKSKCCVLKVLKSLFSV